MVNQGHFLSPAGISFDGLRGCHPRPGPGVPSVRPSVPRGQPPTPVGPTLGVGKQTRAELLFLLYSSGIWSDVGADVGSRAVGHVDQWEVALAAPYREALCN